MPQAQTEKSNGATKNAGGIAAGQLKSFIQRVERLEEEIGRFRGGYSGNLCRSQSQWL